MLDEELIGQNIDKACKSLYQQGYCVCCIKTGESVDKTELDPHDEWYILEYDAKTKKVVRIDYHILD